MDNKKVYFICDFFKEDYLGGAELTTDALIKKSPCEFFIEKIRSEDLTEELLRQNIDSLFVIGNFQNLSLNNKLYLIKNNLYSIIEYDYKFCKYRSLDKHREIESIDCNCIKDKNNRINLLFYANSDKIWFMSEDQRNIYLDKLSFLNKEKTKVLSSVFSNEDLDFILEQKIDNKNDNFVILNSNSWIKGTQKNIEFAKRNNLNYSLFSNLSYKELLKLLASSKGLVFRPLGADTCPRIVIEAKLMGCELFLNDNVQHKKESWFSSRETCIEYLRRNADAFWEYYKNV